MVILRLFFWFFFSSFVGEDCFLFSSISSQPAFGEARPAIKRRSKAGLGPHGGWLAPVARHKFPKAMTHLASPSLSFPSPSFFASLTVVSREEDRRREKERIGRRWDPRRDPAENVGYQRQVWPTRPHGPIVSLSLTARPPGRPISLSVALLPRRGRVCERPWCRRRVCTSRSRP